MFCINCGSSLVRKVKFCSNCGASQELVEVDNNQLHSRKNVDKVESNEFLIRGNIDNIKNANESIGKIKYKKIYLLASFVFLIPISVFFYSTNKTDSALPKKESIMTNAPVQLPVKPSKNLPLSGKNEVLDPTPENCAKGTDLHDRYKENLAGIYGVSAKSIQLIRKDGCMAIVDTPKGTKRCGIGGILWYSTGEYDIMDAIVSEGKIIAGFGAVRCL